MPPAPKRRPPAPKPYHHGNLRETLLDAGDTLLAQRGEAALTLREVAASAGVSHAAPYHHFASREALLAGVAQRGFGLLAEAMEQAAGEADPRERLLLICEAYVACALRRPARFRLMFGPMLARKREFPDLVREADRAFDALVRAASACDAEAGPLLALSGWSLAHGLSNLLIDHAFDNLPMAMPDPRSLARRMGERLLPAAPAVKRPARRR
jgi:AcrR family transcriptional regulator